MLKRQILCAMVLAAATGAATADVIKLTDDATLQQSEGERYFSQSGVSGEVVVPLETAGADMPLSLAANLIIPNNWVVKPSGNFERAKVSFKGGVSWPHILRNIAQDEGIYITLDWVKKVASIHVPGTTKAQEEEALIAQRLLDEKRSGFYKELGTTPAAGDTKKTNTPSPFFNGVAEQKNQQQSAPTAGSGNLNSIVAEQRVAIESNQMYIDKLSTSNASLEKDLVSMKQQLAAEQSQLKLLKEKYAVIDPALGKSSDKKSPDATELFVKFKNLWVKPLDDSFMYYQKGGHAEVITANTPATFIAKKGTVEEVITAWANAVGWHVEYTAGVQHQNPFQVSSKGTFIEVATQFIRVFEHSNRPLNITFYPDVDVVLEDGTERHGLVKVTDLNYAQ